MAKDKAFVSLLLLLNYFQGIGAQGECKCNLSENVLHCDSGFVHQMPQDILAHCPQLIDQLESIQGLNLQDQEVTQLSSGAFAKFPNLVAVQMSYSKIKTIEYGAFDNLNQLSSILLSHNEIETLPDGVFDGTSLKWLDLSYNPVTNYTTR